MSWNPPAQGSKKREAMPSTAFLEPSCKKYPYKVKRGGKYVPSKQGLQAAKRRAAQQGRKDLVAKVDRLLNRYFGRR